MGTWMSVMLLVTSSKAFILGRYSIKCECCFPLYLCCFLFFYSKLAICDWVRSEIVKCHERCTRCIKVCWKSKRFATTSRSEDPKQPNGAQAMHWKSNTKTTTKDSQIIDFEKSFNIRNSIYSHIIWRLFYVNFYNFNMIKKEQKIYIN